MALSHLSIVQRATHKKDTKTTIRELRADDGGFHTCGIGGTALNKSINLNSDEFRDVEKKGRYHVRVFLQGQILSDVMMRTADFIQMLDDTLGVRFRCAGEFMAEDIEDAFSASIDALSRCGFFPYTELMYEFDAFQTLLLQGMFKSSRDSLRRMLDVCLTSVVYLINAKSGEEAKRWLTSEAETPQFSRNINCLKQNPTVLQLDQKFGFTDVLKKLYWHLSDYCHTRGIEFSTGIRKGDEINYDGVVLRGFNEHECRKVMEDFILVAEQLAILLVIQNIGLLAPVDKDAKWGLSQPMSGFFCEYQTERLLEVMPNEYAKYFRTLAMSDSQIVSLRKCFESLPDITEAEMQLQSNQFKKDIQQ